MTFPYSGAGGNSETAAAEIDSATGSAMAVTQAWRSAINQSSAINSLQAQACYQQLVALRALVEARKATPGLAEAYMRRFPGLTGFNPDTDWQAAKGAIEAFALWFQANWPKRVAPTNEPAFAQFSPTDGQLTAFSVPVTGQAKTDLLARLDAVTAAFAPPG